MSINWPVIVIVAILAIALLVFLIKRNLKDKKRFEQKLNDDFHKLKMSQKTSILKNFQSKELARDL